MKQKQQVVAALMRQLSQRSVNIEAKLPDPEGRAQRDNIRIHGAPDEAEGNNISIFLENPLRKLLDFFTRYESQYRESAQGIAS